MASWHTAAAGVAAAERAVKEYTVNEFASRERVQERTVRRWIAKGAVRVRRTPGGGLRILDEPPCAEGRQMRTSPDISPPTHWRSRSRRPQNDGTRRTGPTGSSN